MIADTLDAIHSHALATGNIDQALKTQPGSAPGTGVTAAVWLGNVKTIRSSGLASASVLVVYNAQMYMPMTSDPEDEIDTTMSIALDTWMTAVIGDFQLGGNARHVDVLGSQSEGLSFDAGYASESGNEFRVLTGKIPVIINDLWSQAP